MRSEGFPFIVGGLGVGAVFAWLASCRRLSSSLVVSRRLSSFVVVVASQIQGHWGKLLQVTFHGCVTCHVLEPGRVTFGGSLVRNARF